MKVDYINPRKYAILYSYFKGLENNFMHMDARKAIKKISSDEYNRLVFGYVENAYLVGGFIRDVMTGKEPLDRDYVVEQDPFLVASIISRDVNGKVVTFKDESTVRIALDEGITLDFSRIRKNIKYDLQTRDFTINSIAYNPRNGLLDPFRGADDIRDGIIRTARKDNIREDPLRCLRAYRMKSEFKWEIDLDLKKEIELSKGGLLQISPERITLEFFKMMNGKYCNSALVDCLNEGVLDIIISNNNNKLKANIYKILELDRFIEKLPSKVRKAYSEVFSHNMKHIGIVRLERLLYGIEIGSVRLSFSKQIMKRLIKADRFLDELRYSPGRLDVFDTFFSSRDMIYDLVCLSGRRELLKDARRFIAISKNRLISSSEIMSMTDIRGESFGYLLYCLDREIYYRRIKTKEQARKYIKKFEI